MSEKIHIFNRPEAVPEPGDRFWNVYATKMALERAVAQRKAIITVRNWLQTALKNANPDVKIWDIQKSVEEMSPHYADYVGIILDELETRGFVTIDFDGSFTLEKIDSNG